MGYDKQAWVDNESVLSAERLNHIEQGIYDAISTLIVPGVTVEAGVTHGDFIYPAIVADEEVWKKDTGNTLGRYLCGPVTEGVADAVRAGRMPMPSALAAALSASEIAGQYSIYVQSNGTLGLGTTQMHAGMIRSATEMIVDFNPISPKPKAYTDNMVQMRARSGALGTNLLQLELPDSATGAHLRRSSSGPYAGEGMNNWGDKVADMTDDTGYKGVNEWFIDDDGGQGLTDGVTYYYKAFPYNGSVVNETYNAENDVNVAKARAGLLEHDWNPKDASGSTLLDSAGSVDATLHNISIVPNAGILKDAFFGASGYASIASLSTYDKTFCIWIKPNSVINGLFGIDNQNARLAWVKNINVARIDTRYGGIGLGATPNTWAFVAIYCGPANGEASISINGGAYSSTTLNDYNLTDAFNRLFSGRLYTDPLTTLNTYADVFRIFSGKLTVEELNVLCNGGAGC